jgi:hypothetical protein
MLITNSMFIYMRAAVNALFGRYIGFKKTDKHSSVSGVRNILWNLIFSFICYIASMYALYNAAISSTIEQLRTYLPLSLWLLFYSVILASSIIFVGTTSDYKPSEVTE